MKQKVEKLKSEWRTQGRSHQTCSRRAGAHDPSKRPGLGKVWPGRGQGSRERREREEVCNLASIQETEDDSGVARETARLQRSQVFRFAKLDDNLSRISNFKGTLEKNSIGHKIGAGYFFTGFGNNSRS